MPHRTAPRPPDTTLPQAEPECEQAAQGHCPFEGRMAQMARDIAEIKAECVFQSRLMTGHTDPSRGFIVRLDRLEQRIKLLWTAVMAAVGAICLLGWNAIIGKH